MNAHLVDAALREPAIVLGSLPPLGRDLDLLVSCSERSRLHTDLRSRGWVEQGKTLARFADCTAFGTDIEVLDDWVPTSAAARLLKDAAEPIEGYDRLRAPTRHHRLLILAHRYEHGMQLTDKKRAVLDSFTPADWQTARLEAGQWRLKDGLAALERAAATSVDARSRRSSSRPSFLRRPQVIALSGLDGSGKSTQANLLCAALGMLGFDVIVEWTKLGHDPLVARVANPAKWFLNALPGDRHIPARPEPSTGPTPAPDVQEEVRNYPLGAPAPPDAARLFRQSNRTITWGWTLVIALANGLHRRRTVRRHASRVVVCDRYTLDSLAQLHYRYGHNRPFRLQRQVIRALSPRPVCAFFLDVPPPVARERKPEQYLTPELTNMRQLYLNEVPGQRVLVLDGARPIDELAAEIAQTSWRRLKRRTFRRRLRTWAARRR